MALDGDGWGTGSTRPEQRSFDRAWQRMWQQCWLGARAQGGYGLWLHPRMHLHVRISGRIRRSSC